MIAITGRIGSVTTSDARFSLTGALESLGLTDTERVDQWADERLNILRSYNGPWRPASQPIFNEDRSLLAVMVGSIASDPTQKADLIRRGHVFRFEDEDAEFCLHLYEEKGEGAFPGLNGSFVIVLYHLASGELLAVSDRFASHPLFYRLTPAKELLFSTQVAPVTSLSDDTIELDTQAVIEFFTLQRLLGTKTLYRNISLLPPATIMRYSGGRIRQTRYWEMCYRAENRSKTYYASALAEALRASVRRSMEPDVRYGVLLSGGLDSRMVLAAAEKDLTAITFCDVENREVRIARQLAEAKGCRHVVLKRPPNYYPDLVDRAVETGNGMYSFVHAHAIGFREEISSVCDVLLHGFAPELFFRGTTLPRKTQGRLRRAIRSSPLLKTSDDNLAQTMASKLKYSLHNRSAHNIFSPWYASRVDGLLRQSLSSLLSEIGTRATSPYDRFTWPDIYQVTRYPSSLFQISIRSFMDERAPLMHDNDLLDLHLKMPVTVRCDNDVWLKAMARLNGRIAAIRDANTGVPGSAPNVLRAPVEALTRLARRARVRGRRGSIYTETSWSNCANLIRRNEKLRRLIADVIEDEMCLSPELFALKRIREMYGEHMSGKCDHTPQLCLLLTFGRWQKIHGL